MCAAVPMLISPWPSDVAPTVGLRQVGNEHSQPARFAIWSFVLSEKSCLFFVATGWMLEVFAVNPERHVLHQSPWYGEYQVPPKASVQHRLGRVSEDCASNRHLRAKPVTIVQANRHLHLPA
jgi:hypothetical protein